MPRVHAQGDIRQHEPAGLRHASEGLALYISGSPAFEIGSTDRGDQYEIVARYADRELLQSGWLVGEESLARKAAMVSAKYGEGRVLLIGFRAQHRAQTHGTFKLLFNALVNGPPARASAATPLPH